MSIRKTTIRKKLLPEILLASAAVFILAADSTTEVRAQQAQETEQARPPASAEELRVTEPQLQQGFIVTDAFSQQLSSDIVGSPVYGTTGENIGEVGDLLVGRDYRIVGMVVGVGGFLGIGEKDVGIPIELVTMTHPAAPPTTVANAATADGDRQVEIHVALSRAQLEEAPNFLRADPGWVPEPAPGVPVTGVPEPSVPVAPQ